MKIFSVFIVLFFCISAVWADQKAFFDLVKTGTPEQIQTAIDAGEKVNDSDATGMTPLMLAAFYNTSPSVVDLLLKNGAKVDDHDKEGRTPLMRAALVNSNPEVINVLIKAGAKVDDRAKYGDTPLTMAASFNNPEVITALIKAGAKINDMDNFGQTTLIKAAKSEFVNTRTFAQTHPTAQIVGLRSSFFRYSFHNAAYAP